MSTIESPLPVRVHLTNVAGTGACQLLESLLPSLENDEDFFVERIDLPNRGKLSHYKTANNKTIIKVYKRWLPNALSRLLECTLLAGIFKGDTPLLVLGDLPLACSGEQTVFVHQYNLLISEDDGWGLGSFKYTLARALFNWNISRVKNFIVQTNVMRDALIETYPLIVDRVHVVPQPVPQWLLQKGLKRSSRLVETGKLKLIYPAADYPHKNHKLLSSLNLNDDWPVDCLILTIPPTAQSLPDIPWVECTDLLAPDEMIKAYSEVDALLFLSKKESFGFPLVEAMFIGLPIVCPDLPYARTLCGDQAIYFNSDDPGSLYDALVTLRESLEGGWWPNWKDQLRGIPQSWEDVARTMLEITCSDAR